MKTRFEELGGAALVNTLRKVGGGGGCGGGGGGCGGCGGLWRRMTNERDFFVRLV